MKQHRSKCRALSCNGTWLVFQLSLCPSLFGLLVFFGCDHREPVSRPAPEHAKAMDSDAIEAVAPVTLPSNTIKQEPPADRHDEGLIHAKLSTSDESVQIGDTIELTVSLDIPPTYEIHAINAPPPAVATRLDLDLPPEFRLIGDWSTPKSVRSTRPDGSRVYTGFATFTRSVHVDQNSEVGRRRVSCSVRYQACDATKCMRPVELNLSCDINVRP